MKVLVIGSTGTIGAAIAKALAGKHEVIGVHRKSDPPVDIEDVATVERLFDRIGDVDAVVCAAGNAAWKPLDQLGDDAAVSLVNAGLEGFVRAAALDAKRGGPRRARRDRPDRPSGAAEVIVHAVGGEAPAPDLSGRSPARTIDAISGCS